MRQEFERSLNSLDEIFAFTSQVLGDCSVTEDMRLSVDLLVEEIFTNILKYSPNSDKPVSIDVKLGDEAVTVSLIETDAEPFDITTMSKGAVDVSSDVPEPGGLGLHLVESIADETSYEYDKGKRISTVTMIFYLEK